MFKTGYSLAVLCALVCASLSAQSVSTAQINGTITDSSGLAVPGAEVKATQTATGLSRAATSAADGAFVLPNLPIGPWQLEITKEGFSKYIQSGIVLQVASNPTIEAALKVGSVAEQVLVQADAAMVETHSTGVGTVIDQQRVVDLPLNGRNPAELIILSGAATPGDGAGYLNTIRNYPTLLISVAGGQGNGITYLLDGGNHNDAFNNLNLPLPFPDALQEFKVETSALPAQYGYHSSAAVNAVTKSGTNEFHGDMFDFLRNGDLNARNFFATSRDTLKRNQFGGVIGGPVKKDKLFFFLGYQGTVQKSSPPQTIAFVPTAAMLAGDFTAFTSPGCNAGRQIALKAPFVGNKVPVSQLNPVALKMAALLPATNDPCGRVTFGLVTNSGENIGIARADYQINQKHSMFGRYELARLVPSSSYDGKNVLTATTAQTFDRVMSFVLGETWLIGPNTVSSFRATGNRTRVEKSPDSWFSLADLGSQGVYVPVAHTTSITVTSGFSVGGAGENPSKFNTMSLQAGDDISWVKGTHQFGFGANYIHPMQNVITLLNALSTSTFNGSITGTGLSDLLTGTASAFTQGNPARNYYREHYLGFYAQDSYRITPRLTLSYGLRWEPFLAPYSKIGFDNHFDPAAFAANQHSSVFLAGPAGLFFPGDSNYPGKSSNYNNLNNWAPRAGVVWDPRGDGKMTIRSAYGRFNDFEHLNYNNGFGLGPPFGNTLALSNVNISNPWATYPGGLPLPVVLGPNTPFVNFGTYATQNLHPKLTYLNQWNLSIQRQVGSDWLFTANYIGNSTIHLWAGNAINPAVYLGLGTCTINAVTYNPCSTTGNQNQRRALFLQNPAQGTYYGAVTQQDDGGTSTYEGLLVSAQKRLTKGLTVQGNYTWSHCIGDLANGELGIAGPIYMIPNNRRADRSNCFASDLRHVFNLSLVAQTPKFSNRALAMVVSDWQVSTIIKANSAQFMTVTTGVDNALNGSAANQRPNLTGSSVYPSNQTPNDYLNSAAYSSPATGTYGNLGALNIKGPGFITVNPALSRVFHVREKQTVQIRVEAFNLFNHSNFNAPTLALNSATFGQILTAQDPRIMQLAAKYVF